MEYLQQQGSNYYGLCDLICNQFIVCVYENSCNQKGAIEWKKWINLIVNRLGKGKSRN